MCVYVCLSWQKVQGAGNGGRGNTGRRFHSMEPTTDPEVCTLPVSVNAIIHTHTLSLQPNKYESDGSLHSKHAGYQTDV